MAVDVVLSRESPSEYLFSCQKLNEAKTIFVDPWSIQDEERLRMKEK